MPKIAVRNGNGSRAGTTKYDAHHKVLSQTYGAFADLRRELSDSKETVGGREDILKSFAVCPDSQRAWLLLEDYFEKLSLSRRDFLRLKEKFFGGHKSKRCAGEPMDSYRPDSLRRRRFQLPQVSQPRG